MSARGQTESASIQELFTGLTRQKSPKDLP